MLVEQRRPEVAEDRRLRSLQHLLPQLQALGVVGRPPPRPMNYRAVALFSVSIRDPVDLTYMHMGNLTRRARE